MPTTILFNKPYDVLCQFSDTDGRRCLADYIDLPDVYPAGRLDRDSEGLVVLTDDGPTQHKIAHPEQRMTKTYWAQVEGTPGNRELAPLSEGMVLKDGPTRPATWQIGEGHIPLWDRDPPVRERRFIPTSWLILTISEGRNRQVRRMCAALGFPVLRLIRYRVGSWTLDGLKPGEWRHS